MNTPKILKLLIINKDQHEKPNLFLATFSMKDISLIENFML